ncbi:GntR family transcriptional regulator [Tamaricihabitans halophyticus]|uniref:GntR family transcriptional regulator n=1 Tax=Tamaricihabitans halophyticus TaxID=1262583 RepID=A0A4V6NRC7_9PSEU|nr:GntR family transcriptional regulator [Tamaricihabitans halophyticus]TCP53266.1 GntR family transcriptional regulator [Tamaricihabitans halophyticus]
MPTSQPAIPTVTVDRSSPVPLYYQIAQSLERDIESGQIPAGARLENEIALAERLGMSRPTVRRAIEYLVNRGMLVRKRGVGTQVANPKVRRPIELTSLYDDLTAEHRTPSSRVLRLATVPAPDVVAHALGIGEGEQVYAVERLRYADGEPLAVLRNFIPVDLLELDTPQLEQTGLYRLFDLAGIRLHMAAQVIGARTATAEDAQLIGGHTAEALLTMQRTAYDQNGRGVEYGDHFYRASTYSFEFLLLAR